MYSDGLLLHRRNSQQLRKTEQSYLKPACLRQDEEPTSYLTGAPVASRQIRHTSGRESRAASRQDKRAGDSLAFIHRWLSTTDDDVSAAWKPGKQGLSEASAACHDAGSVTTAVDSHEICYHPLRYLVG